MIKVGVVGGTGYTGVELLRILASHPQVQVMAGHVARGGGREGGGLLPVVARPL
jgi:N-acetyl-gamma-glutamyl-phosphate reductase